MKLKAKKTKKQKTKNARGNASCQVEIGYSFMSV